MAILGAATGFQADDALDLDLGPAPAHPHLVGQRQQLLEPVVGQLQHPQHLVAAQSFAALQYLLACLLQDVGAFGLTSIIRRPSRRLSHPYSFNLF